MHTLRYLVGMLIFYKISILYIKYKQCICIPLSYTLHTYLPSNREGVIIKLIFYKVYYETLKDFRGKVR